MWHARWLVVGLVLLGCAAEESRAQIFINPYGYSGGYVYGSGVRFRYRRHHLRVSGFYGGGYAVAGFGGPVGLYGPGAGSLVFWNPAPSIGSINYNVTVQQPPTIVINNNNGPERGRLRDDLSGIDLDTTDPVTLKPRKLALAKKEKQEEPEVMQKGPARRQRLQLPEKKPKPAARVRPPVRPLPDLPEDKTDPIELGKKAFADRKYGLAAVRFRQAARASAREALPYFLVAQALFALAKYRDAAHAIQTGLDLQKDWPGHRFPLRPLYKGNEVDFLGQLKRLEELVEKHPDDAVLLFVLGYELWFDGRHDKARPLFRKARQFAPLRVYCDRFLKA